MSGRLRFLLLTGGLWLLGANAFAGIEHADPLVFQALAGRDDVIVLDVRTPGEIASGKIEGASELDFYADDFERKLSFLQKDKTVLVYCRSGGRSSEVTHKLEALGHENVVELDGGVMAWTRAGLPLTKAQGVTKKVAAEAVDVAVVLNQLKRADVATLLDFHTTWCVPCKRMAPVIDQLESENPAALQVFRIDLDANPTLAEQFEVKAVPTFVLVKGGVEIWRGTGLVSQDTFEAEL